MSCLRSSVWAKPSTALAHKESIKISFQFQVSLGTTFLQKNAKFLIIFRRFPVLLFRRWSAPAREDTRWTPALPLEQLQVQLPWYCAMVGTKKIWRELFKKKNAPARKSIRKQSAALINISKRSVPARKNHHARQSAQKMCVKQHGTRELLSMYVLRQLLASGRERQHVARDI